MCGRRSCSVRPPGFDAARGLLLDFPPDAFPSEEWIIRDFFGDKRDGVFVDVGANDYRRFSNTYYLEIERGWSGLAIEPQVKFAAAYARYRPKTKFLPLFVSDRSNREAVLYVPANDLIASQSREFAESAGGFVAAVRARTTTLDDVLERSSLVQVDFLTMDIELAEPTALAALSIQRFKPALVCIEGHFPVRQQVIDYFTRTGTSSWESTYALTVTICGLSLLVVTTLLLERHSEKLRFGTRRPFSSVVMWSSQRLWSTRHAGRASGPRCTLPVPTKRFVSAESYRPDRGGRFLRGPEQRSGAARSPTVYGRALMGISLPSPHPTSKLIALFVIENRMDHNPEGWYTAMSVLPSPS
jgi:FkbM family methyltransferase